MQPSPQAYAFKPIQNQNCIQIPMQTNNSQPFLDKPDPEDMPLVITTLDDLLHKVNGQGRYQWVSFMIFNLQWFCIAWMLLGGGFFFQKGDFKCEGRTGQDCEDYVCALDESQWQKYIPPDHPQSIPYAFKKLYICKYEYIITILESLVYIGSLIGFFLFPYVADNWGRKKAMHSSWACCTLGVILMATASEISMIAIGQFLAGFGGNPAITLDYSFINEQSLGKSRQYFSVGIQISLAIGEALLGLIFFEIPNWRTVAYILLVPVVIVNFLLFYLVESPKFMISKDSNITLDILNRIAKINRKPRLTLDDVLQVQQHNEQVQQTGSSLFDLFRYKSLRAKAIASGLVFFGIQVIYYSTSFNLDKVGLAIHINQVIVGVSEGLGYVGAELAIPRVKRRISSFLGMGISSLLCFVLAFIPTGTSTVWNIVSVVFLFIMRFALSMFWAIFYVYLAEMFPTRVRSLAFGWASALGTIGSAASPYLRHISDSIDLSSWIFPGVFGLFSTACIFPLTETLGLGLEEEIEELKSREQEVDYQTYVVAILENGQELKGDNRRDSKEHETLAVNY